MATLCRVCQRRPSFTESGICAHCFATLDSRAVRRWLDTRHAENVAADAETYERLREEDEAARPPKDRGRD
jgi:hypothetical protein